jgi:hypothetical protein
VIAPVIFRLALAVTVAVTIPRVQHPAVGGIKESSALFVPAGLLRQSLLLLSLLLLPPLLQRRPIPQLAPTHQLLKLLLLLLPPEHGSLLPLPCLLCFPARCL